MIDKITDNYVKYLDFECYCRCIKNRYSVQEYTKIAQIKKYPTIETIFNNDWLYTMLTLQNYKYIKNPECYAAKKGSLKILNYFLIQLTNKNKSKNRILHMACRYGYTNIVKHIVIEHKVEITESLLKIAYENNQKDVISYLLPMFQNKLKKYLQNI